MTREGVFVVLVCLELVSRFVRLALIGKPPKERKPVNPGVTAISNVLFGIVYIGAYYFLWKGHF